MRRPLEIVAIVYRKNKPVIQRRYAELKNGIRKMSELAVTDLEPRDVVEFSHERTGLQIGTIRVGVNSTRTSWIWDE